MAKKPQAPPDDSEGPLDALLQFRMRASEKAAWTVAAKADKRKLSDWLRIVANKAAADAGPVDSTRKSS